MPCCAFAACIVAQLLLAVGAIKRAIFGQGAGESTARNIAVEWRLDSGVAPSLDLASASAGWLLGRRSLRGLALAAALEVAIVVGAIYGVVEHLGHGAGHSGHAHRVEGTGLDGGIDGSRALNPDAASLQAFKR
ncbi:MAG TPA: hypothetical protein VLF14_00325 [Candidatus Binatia bacterium]|nr:hypothetical protein [Candidatus Binatia bacterium]